MVFSRLLPFCPISSSHRVPSLLSRYRGLPTLLRAGGNRRSRRGSDPRPGGERTGCPPPLHRTHTRPPRGRARASGLPAPGPPSPPTAAARPCAPTGCPFPPPPAGARREEGAGDGLPCACTPPTPGTFPGATRGARGRGRGWGGVPLSGQGAWGCVFHQRLQDLKASAVNG